MEYLSSFLLILLLSALAAGKATIQSGFARKNVKTVKDSILFIGFTFVFMAVCSLVLFRPEYFTLNTLIYGASTGALMTVFQVFYTLSLKCGPVSLTVLICNFNVMIPAIFSIIAFGEKVYLSYIVGAALLIASMVLSRKKDENEDEVGASAKWLIFLTIALVAAGSFGSVQKYYVEKVDGNNSNAFLLVAYVCAFTVAFAVSLFVPKKMSIGSKFKSGIWIFLLFAGLVALTLSCFQKTYMYTVSVTDGVFFNPTYAGVNSLLMSVIGICLFKDKLSTKQKISFALGIICVVFMNIRLFPL